MASETLIGEHIDTFKKLTAQIEAYVDRTVAHLDPKGFNGTVTFKDLDSAIVALDDLATKYICLFTGRGYPGSLAPTIQFNWKRIFDVAWRKPSGLNGQML